MTSEHRPARRHQLSRIYTVALLGMALGTGFMVAASSAGAVIPPDTPAPTPSSFVGLTPVRILDTRGVGGLPLGTLSIGKIGPNDQRVVPVRGAGGAQGVPNSPAVTAVVMNVTAIDGTAGSLLRVWPSGQPQPTVANVNFNPSQIVPNLVTVAVGTDGNVIVANDAGSVDVTFDAMGYFTTDSGGRWHGISPIRALDTRGINGQPAGAPIGKVAPGDNRILTIGGLAGVVPPTGTVTGVVLNLTITESTGSGFVSVVPGNVVLPPTGPKPTTANINFNAVATRPNLVVVQVPTTGTGAGTIQFYNEVGSSTHIIADVLGYFDEQGAGDVGKFVPVPPERFADSRTTLSNRIPAGTRITEQFTESALASDGFPLPAAWPSSLKAIGGVVVNVTPVDATGIGFITLYPGTYIDAPPNSANVYYRPGFADGNLAWVATSPSNPTDGGRYLTGLVDPNGGNLHIVIDYFGYFIGS